MTTSLPSGRNRIPTGDAFFDDDPIAMSDAGSWPPAGAVVLPYVRESDAAGVRAGKGNGLADQLATIHAECERRGYTVLPEVREAYTGVILDRPGFTTVLTRLRERQQAGQATYVMMSDIDRLTRSDDPDEGDVMIWMIRQRGGDLLVCGQDFTGMGGAINRKIKTMGAGQQRVDLVTKFARRRRIRLHEDNLPLGIGPAPYGYEWKTPAGQKLKRTAYALDRDPLHDGGKRPERAAAILGWLASGLSAGQAREELHRRGWPSPSGNEWWSVDRICELARNLIYCGKPEGNRWKARREHVGRERLKQHLKATPQERRVALVEGTAPAVVTEDVQRRAIDTLERNRHGGRKPTRDDRWLLSDGHALCAHCQQPLRTSGGRAGLPHVYYRCSTQARTGACRGVGSINAGALDAAAWAEVLTAARNPEAVEGWARAAVGAELPEVREADAVEALLAERTADQARRAMRYLELTDAQATLAKPAMEAADAEVTRLETRLAGLRAVVAADADRQAGIRQMVEGLRRVQRATLETPASDRRDAIEWIGLRAIVVEKGVWSFELGAAAPAPTMVEPLPTGSYTRWFDQLPAVRIPLPIPALA